MKYSNGNASITLESDGSRVIEFEDILNLEYPLNIDIRVSTECSLANLCTFCHESAIINGKDCDYEALKSKLNGLPQGIELAIGCNRFTDNLYKFLEWCRLQGYICNLTVNQGHLNRDLDLLIKAISKKLVMGLGISYRSSLKWNIPKVLLDYKNTVFHVISGIDTIQSILYLKEMGVNKVLVLGEKNFGNNLGKVDLTSKIHKEWYWWVHKLFKIFDVVSFDNLALEQLNIQRFFTKENYEVFNQGEHSFYINAVDQYFAPSSRSNNKVNFKDLTVKEYFKSL